MKITLIGGGKLGKQLYKACTAASEIELVQWVVRSAERGKTPEGISLVNDINELHPADLYVLAVTDQAIPKIAAALPEKVFVAHTAGGVALEMLNQNRAGVFYPIQTFSEGRSIDFSKLPIGLECKQSTDLPLLEKLVQAFLQAQEINLPDCHQGSPSYGENGKNKSYGIGPFLDKTGLVSLVVQLGSIVYGELQLL